MKRIFAVLLVVLLSFTLGCNMKNQDGKVENLNTVCEIENLPKEKEDAIQNGATFGNTSLFYLFENGMKYYRYDTFSQKYYECTLGLPEGLAQGEILAFETGAGSGEIVIYVKAQKGSSTEYLSYLFELSKVEPISVNTVEKEQISNFFF